jgi:hypothetical protein
MERRGGVSAERNLVRCAGGMVMPMDMDGAAVPMRVPVTDEHGRLAAKRKIEWVVPQMGLGVIVAMLIQPVGVLDEL